VDFNDEQVLKFLHQWHQIAEDDPKERTRLQARIERALAESAAIRELAGNPLLLTMMAILNRNQELPRDRVELYREASRVLYMSGTQAAHCP
jgi:predicted NACHT family NTPase